ncbi:hypothetical protein [Actinomadura terrae]|uniref:hypothetical protein n=1 Tax=Actinomadura terrae TaxID=604353 RepID=UPI001FA6EC10|nr:hypothetical protein [Actinomadura terrae]
MHLARVTQALIRWADRHATAVAQVSVYATARGQTIGEARAPGPFDQLRLGVMPVGDVPAEHRTERRTDS